VVVAMLVVGLTRSQHATIEVSVGMIVELELSLLFE